MKPIAPNTLLQNRYLIVHLIGKGGMGEVYLAVDQRLGSAVALKRTFFSDDEQLGSAFEREARTLARLRHPVLPKVSDHFTESETQYLVMDHISGEDISKRLEANKKPFPLSWVLFWADHLLDALTYLHTHEPPIVHRDIKPQNLKLTDENNIVLLDFGLSKSSGIETRVTSSGSSIVGYTPHYAPMEQIRGTGTDARSDIYSLSATLYQILTNTVPADALTRADALISGLEDPIKPLNELNPEVSKSISDIILKGMAISQDKRYGNARDMQKALRDAYSRIKSETAAHTDSLNRQPNAEIPPSQIVTEVISSPINSFPSQPPPVSEAKINSLPNGQNFASPAPPTGDQKQANEDFDATLRYDKENHASDTRQSDIKTEVLIAGSTPEIAAAQNGAFDKKDLPVKNEDLRDQENFAEPDNFNETSNFSAFDKNSYGEIENFSPGATVPLFTLDGQNDESTPPENPSDFDVVLSAPNDSDAASTHIPPRDYSAEIPNKSAAPPVKQKSSGKTAAIAGGIGALLILVIAAAAVVWHLAGVSRNTAAEETPLPTPQATLEFSPTPEPTLEAVTDTNPNGNVNANAETNALPESELADTNANNQPVEQSNRVRPAQITPPTPSRASNPRPVPQIVTVKTPPVVEKTPIPKKTPVKNDRTGILQ